MSQSINTGLDEVTSEAKAKLGDLFERSGTYGMEQWIYIQNSSGGAYAIGNVVARKDSVATYQTQKLPLIGSTAGHPSRAVGVCQSVFPDTYFGWVLREGTGLVLADTGGIAANTALKPGDAVAGTLDSGTAVTEPALGWAHVAITAAATGLARVSCRG